MSRYRGLLGFPMFLLAGWGISAGSGAAPVVTTEDYARAERFILSNPQKYILNGVVRHQWIKGTERFYFSSRTRSGKEFLVVDAVSARRSPAFDHAALARSLSEQTGKAIDPANLPFDGFEFVDGEAAIEFDGEGKFWHCTVAGACRAIEKPDRPGEVASPDGRWAVVRRDHNIWLRSREGGAERALTTDGVESFGYGGRDGVPQLRHLAPPTTTALWSPDSKYVAFERYDERGVLPMYFLQQVPDDGSVRPKLLSKPVALPGEPNKEHVESVVVIDVGSGRRVEFRDPSITRNIWSLIESGNLAWSKDSRQVFMTPNEEGRKTERLLAGDIETGGLRQILEESSDTYVDAGPYAGGTGVPDILKNGDILWRSERTDWSHLYLYDRTGKLKRALTRGPWRVSEVIRVDEARRKVYFTANAREGGEDPYQRHLYAVSFDGSGLRLLTPENAEHRIDGARGFSESGNFFIENYSRPDLPPVTVLRTREGRIVMTVAAADISPLREKGFTMPEPFSVLAADGRTKLYGTIFRPARFDPGMRYPVIDVIYPGPHNIRTSKSFIGTPHHPEAGFIQSLAELGFIALTIDGRGTGYRSKSFHDIAYGNMQQAGNLEDHIAGIRQLAQRYRFMDLDRVGAMGHSAGGFATVRALLEHPDFYKVGVASAGDYDARGDDLGFATTYQGPFTPELWDPLITPRLAGRLQGHLLLMQGDMDESVHSSVVMQLVDALIKADKDFDFLIVPNGTHRIWGDPHVMRRRWDYFVTHLLGAEPPPYHITSEGTR